MHLTENLGEEQPTLLTLPARRVAYREMRGDLEEMPAALIHLQAWMRQQSLEPDGDAGIAYFPALDPTRPEPRWEVRCPVAPETPDRAPDLSGCGIKTLEPVTVAVVRHTGPYVEIGAAYSRLLPWLMGQGISPGWPVEEAFVPDPSVEEEDAFFTEIRVPVQ